MYLQLLQSDLTTVTTDYDMGTVSMGKFLASLFGIYNNESSTVNNIKVCLWPGVKNNQIDNVTGYLVSSFSVIKQNVAEEFQVESVVKEDTEAVCSTASSAEDRNTIVFYDGATYTICGTGDIGAMSSSSEKLYIGSDFIFPTLHLGFANLGSYDAVAFALSSTDNATFYTITPSLDETGSLASQDGDVCLGTVNETNYGKVSIGGHRKYWVEVSCTGTVNAQATIDECYWKTCTLPNQCLLLTPSAYYRKSSVPVYTATPTPDFVYPYKGMFAWYTSPLTGDEVLAVEHSYKLPQPDTYNLKMVSSSSLRVTLASTGATTDISVLASGTYYNIIDGMEITLSSSISSGDECNVVVTSPENVFLALNSGGSPGTYYNQDLALGNLTAGSNAGFFLRDCPPSDASATENERIYEVFAYGDDV